jgi:hypothetical protein
VWLIFNTLLPASSKTLYTSAIKFLVLCLVVRHENFVSVSCHLQSGVYVVHPIRGQTGGSRRVPDQGCEQDGEEQ